jgi:predicted transcriptional regulator
VALRKSVPDPSKLSSRSLRREPGSLEAEILGVLAGASEPLSPAELQAKLPPGLAYSTVTTVLARLNAKGQVSRVRDGRRFLYASAVDGAAVVAERMHKDLRRSGDRSGVLLRFVSDLEAGEADYLRDVLKRLGRSK